MTGAIIVGCLVLAGVVVSHIVSESRKNRAWEDEMRRMARRCPDCGGVGMHLSIKEASVCSTCDGRGEIGS